MLNEYEKTNHDKYIVTVGHLYEAGDFLNYMYADDFLAKVDSVNPKLHTIREDKNDRWKTGTKIDFFINCRQKSMFRFAPVLPVVRTQKIYMSYAYNDIIEISIGSRQLHNQEEILEFVNNDGFDEWEDFFDYFYPIIKATEDNWFEGKLIHWTDFKY